MDESKPSPSPDESKKFQSLITDEMLVNMTTLIMKDLLRLAPYIDRLLDIASNVDHPAFADIKGYPEFAQIAREGRMRHLRAMAQLIKILTMDAMRGGTALVQESRKQAVDKAMKDLGL